MTPNVSLPMYDLPEMRADNARFGEALRGLLRAHDWGLITVEFSEREDGIWLSVEDIGIGMSEAVLTGSLLDFGAPPGWSRDFPASRRKEWFPLDQFGIGFFSVGRCRFEACGFYPIAEGRYPAHPHPLRTLGTFADISGESQLEWGGKYGRAASCIKRAVRTRGTAHLLSCSDANSA